MKNITAATMLLLAGIVFAQQPPPPPPMEQPPPERRMENRPKPRRGLHPLLFALESEDFTQEERVRLKKLAVENPHQFSTEMRTRFRKKRRDEARHLLELRNKYLHAANGKEKEQALKELQDYIRADEIRRDKFHKRMLTETEKTIKAMEKRLAEMKEKFKKRTENRDSFIKERAKEIVSDRIPPQILRDAGIQIEK